MVITVLILIAFAGSYLTLRKLRELAIADPLPRWGEILGSLLAWIFVLSSAGWFGWAIYLVVDLFESGALGNLFLLLFIGMATGMALQGKEVLDVPGVMNYIRHALFFQPYSLRRMNLQEELEKKRVADIYTETTGRPFPSTAQKRSSNADIRPQPIARSQSPPRTEPPRWMHLGDQLRDLREGRKVDLSDAWKINVIGRPLHSLYERMSELFLDPYTETLSFRLDVPDTPREKLTSRAGLFTLQQDLYDLLHLLHHDEWLKPFAPFLRHIAFTCYGLDSDSFGEFQVFPFLKLKISIAELEQRSGRFFNAGDLGKIADITFRNGEPIE